MKRPVLGLLAAAAGTLALGAGPASAAKLTVDDDEVQCKKAQFTTIQSAVNAAAPGDSIEVCPGTYTEQVTIPSGKDDLKLYSRNPLQAVIKAPAVMTDPKAIVRVNGAEDAEIRAFTITGPGGGICDSLRYGVRVDGDGSAEIRHNLIKDIRDNESPVSGCQNGNAIQVGRNFEGQTGHAEIVGNWLQDYQKTGVVVDNAGSSAEIRHNVVDGIGVTTVIAQNGLQISRGANAEVQHNRITDNDYEPTSTLGTGILAFELDGGVEIEHNTLARNGSGVYLDDVSGVEVSHNRATDHRYDGYDLVGGSLDNVLSHNYASGNQFDGIFADSDTSNNLIEKNRLEDNVEHDCHDDAPGPPPDNSANVWEDNFGVTQNHPGLCEQGGGKHDGDDD